jgi:hypothetical protein
LSGEGVGTSVDFVNESEKERFDGRLVRGEGVEAVHDMTHVLGP